MAMYSNETPAKMGLLKYMCMDAYVNEMFSSIPTWFDLYAKQGLNQDLVKQ